ncbi:MAG: hypothetical protein AB1725_00615 [Armatimonadota bacterium]
MSNLVGWFLAAVAIVTGLSGFRIGETVPCRVEWYSQPCPLGCSPEMIAGSEKYWCVTRDDLCCVALCYPYRCEEPDGDDCGVGGCAVFAVNGSTNVVCPAPATCDCDDLTEYNCVPPPGARISRR